MYAYGIAPFARIQCSAALVSRPPENAMPTFWPTGRSCRMCDMDPDRPTRVQKAAILADACLSSPTSRPTAARSRRASSAQPLERVDVAHPFLLRTAIAAARRRRRPARRRGPPHRQAHRARARGRPVPRRPPDDRRPLRWLAAGREAAGPHRARAFDFATGTLVLTEAGTKQRASLHVVEGEAALAALDRGGLEPLDVDLASVRAPRCAREPHAQARAHRSARASPASATRTRTRSCTARKLSPLALTSKLDGGRDRAAATPRCARC